MTDDTAADRRSPLADALDTLLAAREPGRTICPSEVARRAAGPDGNWRARMPEVHRLAEAMAAEGEVVLMQKGRPLGAARPKGAYRIARATAERPPATSRPLSGRTRRL